MLLLIGCGRISFDLATDGGTATTDGVTDGRTVDLPTNAITATFGERSSAMFQSVTFDTFISNEAGEATLNYGVTDELRSEQDVNERILLSFMVTAIPTTATVLEATISLEILQTHPSATWELHPVLESWDEGIGDGTAGLVNYTQRTGGQSWSTVGCGVPNSAAPTFTSIANIALGDQTFALDAATVQQWVSTPASNFGLVFYNTFTESVRFASSEHLTDSVRPLLTVTYLP